MSDNQNIQQDEPEQNQADAADNDQSSLSSAPLMEPDALAPAPVKELLPSSNDQTNLPMEVHHHGHVHETKKWKEYLFQFLMLFLAVFCGFLAEIRGSTM